MITDKEYIVLECLDKFDVVGARQIAILVGNKEESVPRRRVNDLIEDKLVKDCWKEGKKAYSLTGSGLNSLEKRRKEYVPGGFTTEHKLLISEVATFIHLRYGISFYSMYQDKDFNNMSLGHAPDLAIGNICYEIELNSKTLSRLDKNFKINAKNFKTQIWVVPSRLKALQSNLKGLAKKYNCDTRIWILEDIQKYVKEADLKDNDIGREIELRIGSGIAKKEVEFE